MVQRVLAAIVVAAGVVLIVVTFASDLFSVGPAFEELTDDFGPIMTDESIAALQADLQGIAAVGPEFSENPAPALAGQLGMSPQGLNDLVAASFPDVATGLGALPEIGPRFQGLVQILADQQENFEGADAIPTDSLPATTVPWGLFGVGVVAILIGLFMFARQGALGAGIAAGFGLVVIVVSLVLALPEKAGDADDLNEALDPVYTAETVQGGQQALAVVGAMGQQMQGEMLPAMAQQLGMSDEQLGGFLGENFPVVAQTLESFPDAMGRFTALLAAFDSNLDNYETLRPVAFSPIILTLIVGGAVMVVAGGAALLVGRRESAAAA